MNINKMAAKDAAEWARAEMFFGEGAGTARKLLTAEFGQKMATIPGYDAAFHKAYSKQDFAKHALAAAKRRHRLDRTGFVRKHAKAVLRGERRNEVVGLILLGSYIHHKGYDRAALEKIHQTKVKIRTKIEDYRRRNEGRIL